MQTTDALSLARRLVAMDTMNPPGREAVAADWLEPLLAGAGFKVTRHEFAPNRPSLVALLGGEPYLALTGHLDTVPAREADWSFDPLAGDVVEGCLRGLGSSDMKAGVACILAAGLEAAALVGQGGAPLERGLALILTAGEETGCKGAEHLADGGLLPRAEALMVAEPTGARPLLGHKGALWLTGRTKGRAAHGSRPQDGDNAVYKAARAISRLAGHQMRHPAHPLLGPSTFNLGTIAGGVKTNVVPAHCEFSLDVRVLPGQGAEAVMAELGEVLGPEVELAVQTHSPALMTEPDHPWVRRVGKVVEEVAGEPAQPGAATFFTDGPALARGLARGGEPVPVVLLGPGVMAHQADERCPVAQIDEAARIYARLIKDWLG